MDSSANSGEHDKEKQANHRTEFKSKVAPQTANEQHGFLNWWIISNYTGIRQRYEKKV
jgi:hypothetical protein